MTRRKLQTMLNATEYRDVAGVLDAQGGALFHLGAIGELLVPNFPFQVSFIIAYHACHCTANSKLVVSAAPALVFEGMVCIAAANTPIVNIVMHCERLQYININDVIS
jgi:hypothetical protein